MGGEAGVAGEMDIGAIAAVMGPEVERRTELLGAEELRIGREALCGGGVVVGGEGSSNTERFDALAEAGRRRGAGRMAAGDASWPEP